MSAIEIIAPGTYRVDNGRGTQLTLIKKSGHGSPHWEVQSLNARTRNARQPQLSRRPHLPHPGRS